MKLNDIKIFSPGLYLALAGKYEQKILATILQLFLVLFSG